MSIPVSNRVPSICQDAQCYCALECFNLIVCNPCIAHDPCYRMSAQAQVSGAPKLNHTSLPTKNMSISMMHVCSEFVHRSNSNCTAPAAVIVMFAVQVVLIDV